MANHKDGQIAQDLLRYKLSNTRVNLSDIEKWSDLLEKSASVISQRTKILKEEIFAYGLEILEKAIGFKLPVEDSKRVPLNEEKRDEIALGTIRYLLHENGLEFKNIPREAGNISKATGISKSALVEFIAAITKEILDEILVKTQAKETKEFEK